jgi:hypothetical protein
MQAVPLKLTIEAKVNFEFHTCKLTHITGVFLLGLGKVFGEVISQVLHHFAQQYMESGQLKKLLGQSGKLSWKNLHGSAQTCLHTIFGKIWIPQLQVKIFNESGYHTKCITRLLLGVSPHQRIPDEMKQMMGLLASLCSLRSAQVCVNGVLGAWKYGLGSIHRATQWLAERIDLSIKRIRGNTFVADGTGIATLNTGKRGSELKLLAQIDRKGKLWLSNISIGNYGHRKQWEALFAPLKEVFNTEALQKDLQFIMDGCKGILAAAKSVHSRVKIQRDVWHIGHQLKYFSWKDKINEIHKAALFRIIFKAVFPQPEITKTQAIEHLTNAVLLCEQFEYKHTMSFLMNAAEHLYTHHEIPIPTLYSTKIERMMRTVNQRMDIGVWSEKGALAVAKIRLAYFYNGFGREMLYFYCKNTIYTIWFYKKKSNRINGNICFLNVLKVFKPAA